ncbi:syntaxin-17-like [Lineus longissimus]|uniref:syntaxin-17-like n=1 Tax=Lineus longissimus TaxID=88925 RepID=UPI002B4F81A3
MASSAGQSAAMPQKFPLRRLEQTVQKFIKILQIDLERLQKHQVNIERFQRLEEWTHLNREHINSSRTVQQLKANIQEIENTRTKVLDSDVEAFDKKIENIRQEASMRIIEFLNLYGHDKHLEKAIQEQGSSRVDVVPVVEERSNERAQPQSLPVHLMLIEDSISEPDYHRHDTPESIQLIQQQHRQQMEAESSSETLHQNLVELDGLMTDFSKLVHEQKEKVDTIEDNLTEAKKNVSGGTRFLAQAAKLKTAAYPVAGALLGGVVGGPVGLVAGAKLGLAAAIGGGLLGLTSGGLIKRHRDRQTDMEMKKLENRSSSCPENLDKVS